MQHTDLLYHNHTTSIRINKKDYNRIPTMSMIPMLYYENAITIKSISKDNVIACCDTLYDSSDSFHDMSNQSVKRNNALLLCKQYYNNIAIYFPIFLSIFSQLLFILCCMSMLSFSNILYADNSSNDIPLTSEGKTYTGDGKSSAFSNPLSSGRYSFGLGIGYGFDSIHSFNHKTSVFLSSQWVTEKGWLLEVPFILSYIAPDARYFNSFFNNIGDGVNADISVLSGYYLIYKENLKVAIKGGIGYSISYMWASANRMTTTSEILSDTAYSLYNALSLRIGTEIGYQKHALGIYYTYYIPMSETLSLLSRTNPSSATGSIIITRNESNAMLFDTMGFYVYYMYRF